MSAAEYVFRHAGCCLLEAPELDPPRPADVENWAWVATIWSDRRHEGGWGVLEWAPGERGWTIPDTTALGDVVEFGVGALDASGATRFDRWWGWINRVTRRAVVIVGPFDHPSKAEDAARATVDDLRLDQLDEPDIVDTAAAVLGPDLLD
jgi:hypothetical protein